MPAYLIAMKKGEQRGVLAVRRRMLYFMDSPVKAPYWQEISRFLKVPLQPELLLIAMALSALTFVIPPSFNGYLVSAVIVLVASIFSIPVMKIIAKTPYETVSIQSIFKMDCLLLSVQSSAVLFGISALCFFSFESLSPILGVLLASIFLLIAPCWLLAVGRENGFRDTFEMKGLIAPLSQMGVAYIGLIFCVFSLILSVLVVEDYAWQHLPPLSYWPVTVFSVLYGGGILGAIFGHILAEYRLFESLEVNEGAVAKALPKGKETLKIDATMDIAIKEGDYDKALKVLEDDLKKNSQSEYRRMQFLKLILVMNDMTRLERHVHGFLNTLVGRNQVALIEEIVNKVRGHNPAFYCSDLSLSLKLAQIFQKKKEFNLVVWLAEEAHVRFDLHEDLAELYLLASKVMVTNLKQVAPAKRNLQFIVQNFDDLPVAELAKILLSHVDKYSGSSSGKKA